MYAPDPAPLTCDPRIGVPPADGARDDDPLVRAIGGTPLVPLRRLAPFGGGFELWGKAEFRNPSGSVKDRAARAIVLAALADGRLGPGRRLIDASSGNTGVAYAMLGARLGFEVELYVPRSVAPDRLRRMRGFGATVVLTDPVEGTDGAQRVARRRADELGAGAYFANQYDNPANPEAHFATTGPELWRQSHGRITHLVAGVGTGGTISGAGRYLKERSPAVQVVGVEPTGPIHGLEGLKHLPTAVRPATYDGAVVDRTVRVDTEAAVELSRRLAREEGLAVGPSAGAAVAAALVVGESSPGSFVVAILPDGGHAEPEVSP